MADGADGPTTVGSPIRLAVVGCGAAAERLHLPVLVTRGDCQVSALVDPAAQRAGALAERFGVGRVMGDHRMLEDVDAAIVVTPNHLHAPVAMDLMRRGIDVLVEKPVARTVEEVDAMAAVSAETGTIAAVGMELRFAAVNRSAKALLDSGALGRVVSFSAWAGVEFGWPVATSAILRRGSAGGGVLIDVGVHALDLLLWWLGDVESFDYRDDSYGGVEADCLLELAMASGAVGTVELSRTRDLGHAIVLTGDRGELRVTFLGDRIDLSVSGGGITGVAPADVPGGRGDVLWSMAAEHEDFLGAVRTRRAPVVGLAEARRSLALVEDCYRERRLWDLPWVRPPGPVPAHGGDAAGEDAPGHDAAGRPVPPGAAARGATPAAAGGSPAAAARPGWAR